MKKRYSGILLLTFLFFITGCHKDPQPKDLRVDYSWNYNADRDSTYISAVIRDIRTGRWLESLPPNSEIRFNSDLLVTDLHAFLLGVYKKEYGGYIGSGTFNYKDAEGVIYSNPITFMHKRVFPSSFTSVTRNVDFNLNWEGDTSQIGEDFNLTIYNIGVNDFQSFNEAGPDKTGFFITADKLNTLFPGTNNAVAFMQWNRSDDMQPAPPAGATLSQHIYGPNKVISVN